jgi:Flp pilus assembly protein CpaB
MVATVGFEPTIFRRIQMRKINLFAAAAALILAGIGSWAASTTHASVAALAPLRIDPFQMMVTAPKDLPTQQEVDRRLEQMNPWRCDSACARVVQDYFTNS